MIRRISLVTAAVSAAVSAAACLGLAPAALATGPAVAQQVAQVAQVVQVARVERVAPPVTIGQAVGRATCPSSAIGFQSEEATGPSYTVPSGGGVVTSWSYEAGGVDGRVQLAFATAESAPGVRTIVATSAKAAAVGNTLNTFPIRLPVPGGAVMGLWTENSGMDCASPASAGSQEQLGFFDPDTTTHFFAVTQPAWRVDASAVIEPDADHDRYGDLTQDLCPQSALTQSACPAPDTKIVSAPERHGSKRRVKIEFAAEPGATFTCTVNSGAPKPCASPFKEKVHYGRNVVMITATSQFGVVETTPAKVKFHVEPS